MTPLSLHQKILGLHSRRTRILNELIEALAGPISSTDRLGVLNGQRDQVEKEIAQSEEALTLLLSDSNLMSYPQTVVEQPTPSRKRPEAPSPKKSEREQKRRRSDEGLLRVQHSHKAVQSSPKPNPFQQKPASFVDLPSMDSPILNSAEIPFPPISAELRIGESIEGKSTNEAGFCWKGFGFGEDWTALWECCTRNKPSSLLRRFCSRSDFFGLGASGRFLEGVGCSTTVWG